MKRCIFHITVSLRRRIKRFRLDFTIHLNTLKNEAIVLSQELSAAPKNSGEFTESTIIDHLPWCCGEAVSENASVGKSCLTTEAKPQHFVDVGLDEVVIVIFLENNHGNICRRHDIRPIPDEEEAKDGNRHR